MTEAADFRGRFYGIACRFMPGYDLYDALSRRLPTQFYLQELNRLDAEIAISEVRNSRDERLKKLSDQKRLIEKIKKRSDSWDRSFYVAIYLAGNGDSINKTMAEFYSASTQYLKLLDFLIEKLKKPIRRRKGIWTKAIIKALSEIYTEATGKHVKYGTGVEDICGDGLLFIVETMSGMCQRNETIFGEYKARKLSHNLTLL